jgi:uncharacterized protein YndB with AHSA1/START domain
MIKAVGTEPVVKEVRIDARPETVFAFFTEPDKLTRWLCEEATVDPRPGGACLQTHIGRDGLPYEMRGQFLEVSPPARLVFSWGFENPEMATRPGSSIVEVTLHPDGDGTMLRLVHRDLPESEREDHEAGWRTLLQRLARVVTVEDRQTGERAAFQPEGDVIRWRLHLRSKPDDVYEMLATDAGRARFWAESTEESAGGLVWHLLNEPRRIEGRVLERVPGRKVQFEYFAGSTALFALEPDGKGGTDLTLEAGNVDQRIRSEMTAGWVTVLMALKAATDFGIDLRNHDPERTWDQGFVDD